VNLKKWNLNLATNARMFLDSGRNTRASGECEPKKWNLNLATNARMFWIRGETQFLGGECESKKMEFEFSHECTNVLDSGLNSRARWRM